MRCTPQKRSASPRCKARHPDEFGVKVSVAVTHQHGLMVGARSFAGNPYDGHTLRSQLEQTGILLQDLNVPAPKVVVVDLGYRGHDVPAGVQVIHRGRYKSLTRQQKTWFRPRQAVEPAIGHAKSENRLGRCFLKGALGDAMNAVLAACGYNLRWLLRQIARLGLRAAFFAPDVAGLDPAPLRLARPANPLTQALRSRRNFMSCTSAQKNEFRRRDYQAQESCRRQVQHSPIAHAGVVSRTLGSRSPNLLTRH